LGKRSLLDVLDSKVELFLARKNYINAMFDERKSSYRLINATGKLIAALRVDTPKAWQLDEDKSDHLKNENNRFESQQQTDQVKNQHLQIDASQIDN
jgi:adhesin transport system outer membrane protein